MTSSARASDVGGTSRPSAFAVLRLMTSWYLSRQLNRKFVWLCTPQNAIDVDSGSALLLDRVESVRKQASLGWIQAEGIDRGQMQPGSRRNDQFAASRVERVRCHDQAATRLLAEASR